MSIDIIDDISENRDSWSFILEGADASYNDIPQPFGDTLTKFQKFTIFCLLHPEKVNAYVSARCVSLGNLRTKFHIIFFLFQIVHMVKKLNTEILGTSYSELEKLNFHDVLKESNCETPVLILLADSTDALPMVSELSETLGIAIEVKAMGDKAVRAVIVTKLDQKNFLWWQGFWYQSLGAYLFLLFILFLLLLLLILI